MARELSERELAQRRANNKMIAEHRRSLMVCGRGLHPLWGENLYVTKAGVRRCRTCARDGVSRRQAAFAAQLIANPEDERHGTYNAYDAGGCKCGKCRAAYYRCHYGDGQRKESGNGGS